MNFIERFATSVAIIAVPFMFSGCKDEEKPLPMDQEIVGTATRVVYDSPFATSVYSVNIYFNGTDGQSYVLSLVAADRADGTDREAYAVFSTKNFMTTNTKVVKDTFDSSIKMTQNDEYNIVVNVLPGAEMTVRHDRVNMGGYKSFAIRVPSDAVSELYFGFGNEAKVREMFNDQSKITETVEYFLDNIVDSRFEPGKAMVFSADLLIN